MRASIDVTEDPNGWGYDGAHIHVSQPEISIKIGHGGGEQYRGRGTEDGPVEWTADEIAEILNGVADSVDPENLEMAFEIIGRWEDE